MPGSLGTSAARTEQVGHVVGLDQVEAPAAPEGGELAQRGERGSRRTRQVGAEPPRALAQRDAVHAIRPGPQCSPVGSRGRRDRPRRRARPARAPGAGSVSPDGSPSSGPCPRAARAASRRSCCGPRPAPASATARRAAPATRRRPRTRHDLQPERRVGARRRARRGSARAKSCSSRRAAPAARCAGATMSPVR